MKTTQSFALDREVSPEGLFLSHKSGDITVYAIFMVKPNEGEYLQNEAIHTLEHLFAAYAQTSVYSENIVHMGPMGSRTGFYLLTRNINGEQTIEFVKAAIDYVCSYTGWIVRRNSKECGNYIEHSLELAQKFAGKMKIILADWTSEMLINK